MPNGSGKKSMLESLSALIEAKGFATGFAIFVAACALVAILSLPTEKRDVEAICSIIQTAAVVLGLLSLVLIARQIRTTAAQTVAQAAWSKSLSYHQFFGDLVTAEVRDKIIGVADKCGFVEQHKKGEAISSESVKKISDDSGYDSIIMAYLDEFEEFCGAIHAGLLDEKYAYCLESNRVVKTWTVFKPYIDHCRGLSNFRTYLELERVACNWQKRLEIEDAKEQEDADRVHAQRAMTNGVNRRVPG